MEISAKFLPQKFGKNIVSFCHFPAIMFMRTDFMPCVTIDIEITLTRFDSLLSNLNHQDVFSQYSNLILKTKFN